jgi:hypothetical protein
MKKCSNCGLAKPLDQFYQAQKSKDGRAYNCKDCHRAHYQKLREDPDWVEKERARCREKGHKYKPTKEKARVYLSRYYEKFPEKKAVERLKERTARPGFNYHHWSYQLEHKDDVIELTVQKHRAAHTFLKYDKGAQMYRTLNGDLLDTRQKHEQYLCEVLQCSVATN